MTLHAVVVTYHPEESALRRLVDTLREGGARVIVADNTPDGPSPVVTALADGIELIDMFGNAGIAAAQNAGIRAALKGGAEVLAFFDQDSAPDAQLLPSLVAALGQPPRGVAAPVCIDMRNGMEYPPYRFNRWGWASPAPAAGLPAPVEADLIISSGSVVAADVFARAGLMEEGFFIDYVDLEWCIRCRKAAISIRVVPSVTMSHAIGNEVIENGPLTTFVHSPERSYYRLRNAFLLIRMRHVPRLYALHEVGAALVHHLLQWRHSQNRSLHVRFGRLALVDGLRGVRGRFDPR
jgi:rhamnosyltransferase